MYEKIKSTAKFLIDKYKFKPTIGIVLGSGLGQLVEEIEIKYQIPYASIPGFPIATVEGHQGNLIFGSIGDTNVVAMQGRFHYYEGYTMQEVTFPTRVMKLLGIKYLLLSNASGGMNPNYKVGDLMIINDHINLMPNPLIGPNLDELGPRFPDMSEPYSYELINLARDIAKRNNINVHTGSYVGLTGPTYETPKEYEYLRAIGADVVGMSTVPEVIVARHMNITCFALSVITDLGIPGEIVPISHKEVIQAAQEAENKVAKIVIELAKICNSK